MEQTYDASFASELGVHDRVALNRRGRKLYEDAFSVFAPTLGEDTAAPERTGVLSWPETTYHVVRLTAQSPHDARARIIDALGREPDNLTIRAPVNDRFGQPSDSRPDPGRGASRQPG